MKNLNVVKVFVVVMTLSLATATVHAQKKGDMAAGGHLAVSTGGDFSSLGLGAEFQYNVLDQLRLEGCFTYFFKKKVGEVSGVEVDQSMWDLFVNAHWLFPVMDKFTVYPIVGLGVFGMKASASAGSVSVSASESYFAFNGGAGAEYSLTDNLSADFTIKYTIVDPGYRTMFSLGLKYKF